MDIDEFIDLGRNIEAEKIGEHGILTTVTFPSRIRLEIADRSLTEVLAEIHEWNREQHHTRDAGQTTAPTPDHFQVSAYSDAAGIYQEAFRLSTHERGPDGYACFQFASHDSRRQIGVLSSLERKPDIRREISKIEYGVVTRLGKTDKFPFMSYFNQQKPAAPAAFSNVCPVSDEVIQWFGEKGWLLYDLTGRKPGLRELRKMAERGPAEGLIMGTTYGIYPASHNPSSPEIVKEELEHARETRQAPVFDHGIPDIETGKSIVRGIIVQPDGVCLIFNSKMKQGEGLHIPYNNVKFAINDGFSSYTPRQMHER
ncbi:MAG TPA: hypothetical protein VJH88_05410 [Candidatus Nanoarchaeia archaeon]|nr:hypothetical protein [Candidatus Nanoarchaeia archaeon]